MSRTKPQDRFMPVLVAVGEGRSRHVLQVQCRKCPNTDWVGKGGNGHWMPTDKVIQKFEQRGWRVFHDTHRHDTCPSCVEAERAQQQRESTEMPSTHPKVADRPVETTVVNMVREPSKLDKRHILDKLEELYDLKAERYVDNWSDARLAESMNWPRAWVTAIREEFYGPDRNMAQAKTKQDLEAFLPKLKAIEERHLNLASEAEQMHRSITAALRNL